MARRATSLGPKPSLFVFFVCFLFFVFFFFASFPFFVFNRKKPVFPPKKGIFWFIFTVSLSFSLNLFWPPPFSLSLSLSLCFALVFLSSFLSFFFGFLCLSCFCLFFCSIFCAFVSWKEQHENIKLEFLFFIKMFSFWGFLSCFLFEISFPYLCFFFPDFELCFLFNIIVFGFKKPKLKNTFFQKKGGCNKTGFFLWTCVLQNVKSYRFFFGIFFAFFGLFFKKHYKNRHFSTFFKAKNYKKNGIFGSYYLVQVGSYYLVQVDCILKNANLDQIITSKFFVHNFFSKKKGLKPLFL